jgi:hypothetical protein
MSRPRFLADHDLNEHIVTGALRQEPVMEFSRVRDLGISVWPEMHPCIADALLNWRTSQFVGLVTSSMIGCGSHTGRARTSAGIKTEEKAGCGW